MPRPMPKSYDSVTKILHWLIFLAVATQYAVGEFMPHIGEKTLEVGLVYIHIFLGGIVLALNVVAIIWRLTHPVSRSAASRRARLSVSSASRRASAMAWSAVC